jgi:4-hydroxythreonine-4-phosphate dehydrogenase
MESIRNSENRPIIGITMGDPAGIGPEIVTKVMLAKGTYELCRPMVVGDAKVMQKAIDSTNLKLVLNPINTVSNAQFKRGILDVFDLQNVDLASLEMGKISAMAGDAAFEAVTKVIDLALSKQIDATVTGPINKESLNKAGHHFSGHTEIYAHFTKTKKYAMLLVHGNLRVIHVSTHVSLKEACDLVKRDRILEIIELLNNSCQQFGIRSPRIGVAGLNPHASDGGLFGNEEKEEIIPAIKKAQKMGINIDGPIPADTLFTKAKGGLYDGCVAMYHDQGHIPFKMQGFVWDRSNQRMKSVQGVNITLGLPIIRTSVDHGTAFEIAGKGLASPDALALAIEYAVKLAKYHG